ncbi:ATP-grasp peptide maturase system methyltransferase [Nocardiopsis aegyptia]|uniref:Protein-L-isoaspartate O-methyltransferase n=1 Tax=Nocardiopsis aegyptia TaxID=220378 RepID=A0A7Z0EQP1_9ACTN|nr:ATP-grasp peptide maturase system methyltransferase [Nocardiopsis aegyptia]NYJ36384.1 methyltransferase of ATP-grasp peptide maturase system [Nocardiopsis aegyptia]
MTRAVQERASALIDRLVQTGALAPAGPLTEAFRRVDRGTFVPAFALYEHTSRGTRYRLVRGDIPEQREEWASHVYADETLIIEVKGKPVREALPDCTGKGRWTSSSTMPGLMAQMLNELDLKGTPRVLEIGVGSGYNAAILSEFLGSDRVTSIDISPRLVSDAAERLAGSGYHPVVAEYDGHKGYPGRAPYDRIISTTAFTHVPPAWLEQVAPGGLILVNIAGGTGGAVLKLQVGDDGTAEGRFLPEWAGFMPARSHDPRPRTSVDDEVTSGETSLDPARVRDLAFAFVAQRATVDADTVLRTADDGTDFLSMEGRDGAWAEVDIEPAPDGRFQVTQGGPRRLWTMVEDTHRWRVEHGEPEWSEFGATVTAEEQFVWHGSPVEGRRWPLSRS